MLDTKPFNDGDPVDLQSDCVVTVCPSLATCADPRPGGRARDCCIWVPDPRTNQNDIADCAA
eukprot:3500443-Pyramimonas_sp.AAC.1